MASDLSTVFFIGIGRQCDFWRNEASTCPHEDGKLGVKLSSNQVIGIGQQCDLWRNESSTCAH
jgi:hypothetical protein